MEERVPKSDDLFNMGKEIMVAYLEITEDFILSVCMPVDLSIFSEIFTQNKIQILLISEEIRI